MRLRQYINEEYFGRTKNTEVFRNPGRKELKRFKEVKFLLDSDTKNIYVWNASSIHWNVWDNVIKTETGDSRDYMKALLHMFPGSGIVKGNKIEITESEIFNIYFIYGEKFDEKTSKYIKQKFSWAKKFFTNWKELFK